MNRAAAGLLFLFLATVPVVAQDNTVPPTNDPLFLQRRMAMVLRQATKYFEAGDYQAAIDRLGALQGEPGQDPSVLNLRGAILTKLKRYDEAREVFTSILRTDANYFPAAFNLGEVQFLSGDREGALETFQSIRRRDPRNELVRFKVLLSLLVLDREEDAQKIAAGLIPAGNTPAWYYAQAMLTRKAGDEKTAQKHLHAARSIYLDPGCKLFDESIEDVKF
jgi:tetratricopeptide (TPR) repeat protein